jgi:hypothetical protein
MCLFGGWVDKRQFSELIAFLGKHFFGNTHGWKIGGQLNILGSSSAAMLKHKHHIRELFHTWR